MADDVIFKGCPYPILKHPLGYLHTQWDIDTIKSDLRILLLTSPGERVMMPNYGTSLKRLIFEPNDTLVLRQVRQSIAEAIRIWEPRIQIEQIEVFTGTNQFTTNNGPTPNPPTGRGMTGGYEESDSVSEDEHVLGIKIKFFDPQNINQIQELILQVPLQ